MLVAVVVEMTAVLGVSRATLVPPAGCCPSGGLVVIG
jgi:hypothetical protein